MPYQMSQDVARYLVPGATYDALRQPLYDGVQFSAPIAAGTVIPFFQIPVGAGTGIGGGAKTELDTNMRLAGALPAGFVFEVWEPRIVVAFENPTSASAPGVDSPQEVANDFIYGSFFRFRIVTQEKLLCPVYYLPAGAGLVASMIGFQAAAANFRSSIVSHGHPSRLAVTPLDPFPIVIPPQQQFTVEITSVTGVPNANVGGLRVWVVLDGILHRPALP
jgi:hypothetical protein